MACHSSVLSETKFPQLSFAGTRPSTLVSCSSAVLSGGMCGAALWPSTYLVGCTGLPAYSLEALEGESSS